MAKGWDGIQEQAEETAARRAEMQATFLPELRVNDKNPGPYTVRFLEQGPDVHNYPVHEYKVPGNNGVINKRFTCLSEVHQPCPGCQAGLKVKRRGVFNLIQRSRPVVRKGQDGKALRNPDNTYVIDGYADAVVVLNVGGPAAEALRKFDGQFQGLMSRDFHIQFSGDTFQNIAMFPVLDAQGSSNPTPMSDADLQLAANKHNLDEYMKPPDFQEAARIVARYGNNSGVQQPPQYGAPPAQATQHGVPVANQPGATGFLAGAVPGAPVNAFEGQQQPQQASPPAPPVAPPASPAPPVVPPGVPAPPQPPAPAPVQQ